MVFAYLVEKGLLRMGAELTFPSCALPSWIALDALKQINVCELCGSPYDATRQLTNERFHYRRSGVLGLEKNSQGAIPVALVLQQLAVNLSDRAMYAPSYDLEPKAGVSLPASETDLFWIDPDTFPDAAQVIIGECRTKDGSMRRTLTTCGASPMRYSLTGSRLSSCSLSSHRSLPTRSR